MSERWFLDEVVSTGEWFLVPCEMRDDWDAWEEEYEKGRVAFIPEWAVPTEHPRWTTFEEPEQVIGWYANDNFKQR
jgi:hypothetical protein